MKYFQKSRFVYLLFGVIIGLSANQCTNGADPKILPLEEGYKPDHLIEFPHEIHTSKGIDCKYCHNTSNDGGKRGIPIMLVCTNCHKQINGNSSHQKKVD